MLRTPHTGFRGRSSKVLLTVKETGLRLPISAPTPKHLPSLVSDMVLPYSQQGKLEADRQNEDSLVTGT